MSSDKINTDALEKNRSATVDVLTLVEDLVSMVRGNLENPDDPSNGAVVDTTWEILEAREPQADLSNSERMYVVAYLFTNYGLTPAWIVEDDQRISHGTTWDTITWAICEFALYEAVSSRVDGSLTPRAQLGEWHDSRSDVIFEDWTDELREDVIQNRDLEDFICVLAEEADENLSEANSEVEAIDMAIDNYRDELFTFNPINQAAIFDGLEEIYGMTGENAIVSEQLSSSTTGGWAEVIQTGLLYHALREAVRTHRERYNDVFQAA